MTVPGENNQRFSTADKGIEKGQEAFLTNHWGDDFDHLFSIASLEDERQPMVLFLFEEKNTSKLGNVTQNVFEVQASFRYQKPNILTTSHCEKL